MNAEQVITLAQYYLIHMTSGMVSSARVCLEDAHKAQREGKFEIAKRRAVKSLAYSIGIAHPDYIAANDGIASL